MKMTVNIPAEIDTEKAFSVMLSNTSSFIVEARLDSPDGTAITVLTPGERNKRVYIKPEETGRPYRFFPVYVDGEGRRIESSGVGVRPGSERDFTILEFSGPPGGGDSLSRNFQVFNERP
jgi:hypothetical protein